MKRAYVGLSSPIAYDYSSAKTDKRGNPTTPEPILYGSMGLLLFYDEIYFANATVCPRRMRKLPYVKFLNHPDNPEWIDDEITASIEARGHQFHNTGHGLGDVFDRDWLDGLKEYHPRVGTVDYHSTEKSLFGASTTASLAPHNLAFDLATLERFEHLDLEIALNGMTDAMLTAPIGETDRTEEKQSRRRLEIAEKVICVTSIYDIIGARGPYHPVVEDLRNDDLLINFRRWLTDVDSRLDNQEVREIERDVSARVREFTESSLRKAVSAPNLKELSIEIFKGLTLDLLPPSSVIATIIESRRRKKQSNQLKWLAYVALARDKISGIRRTL